MLSKELEEKLIKFVRSVVSFTNDSAERGELAIWSDSFSYVHEHGNDLVKALDQERPESTLAPSNLWEF